MSVSQHLNLLIDKIKNKLSFFLFKGTKWLKFPFKSNRLLIVRLDAIGDYILFRNFLKTLKQHPVWGSYKISLLGNRIFKEMAEYLDKQYVDEFIWFDNNKTHISYYKLCALALKLKLKCFDVLIHPVHSREGHIDEFCCCTGSKYIIGSAGDLLHFKNEMQKKKYDKIYNRLIPALSNSNFEFLRNAYFFKDLCDDETPVELSILFKKSSVLKDYKYNIVIVPGAGADFRRWSPDNYAVLIDEMNKVYAGVLNIQFYIIGAAGDKEISTTILGATKAKNITDLIGNTTLVEVIDFIGSSNLVISNDTSAVHIAAATNASAICLSNGNHFGRFNPYPSAISDCVQTIYPDNNFYTAKNNQRLLFIDKYSKSSCIDINLIKPETVLMEVEKLLERVNYKWVNH